MNDNQANDEKLREFWRVLRQALLMIVAWIEKNT